MQFALVDPTDVINRFGDDTRIDPTVSVKVGWRWLPVEKEGDDVPFDPNTQVMETQHIVEPLRVLRLVTVRAKTTEELEGDKTIEIDRMDKVVLRALFNHENRLRTLEGRANITVEQFITGLRALL